VPVSVPEAQQEARIQPSCLLMPILRGLQGRQAVVTQRLGVRLLRRLAGLIRVVRQQCSDRPCRCISPKRRLRR